jgi:putative nucleotidyltransferase with HDIG domain
MSIDDLIQQMADTDNGPTDDIALQAFTTALLRLDTDPAEGRRIAELAELVDSQIAAYDQGLAALDRGDDETAETLLLKASLAELGDADGLLAELLAQRHDDATPFSLRQRAAEARAHRAILHAAYTRPGQDSTVKNSLRSLLRKIPNRSRRGRTTVAAEDLAQVLMTAMEVKDPETRRHSERMAQLVVLIAHEIGMRPARIEAARLAGLFHDIGKLAIPNTVLYKSGALTQEEFISIQQHVVTGVAIIQEMPEFFGDAPDDPTHTLLLQEALSGIRYHHERFNGRGWPQGLAGHDIPEIARVIAVADAFDAMTTVRSYRAARSLDQAVEELRRSAGQNFDPYMVEAFLNVLTQHEDHILELGQADRPPSNTEPTPADSSNPTDPPTRLIERP